MKPVTCHLLAAVDILEPCPGGQCPFFDDSCQLTGLRSDMSTNPALVQFLLGMREKLEVEPRPFLAREPGFD
ncbi:MAG TPA: hypothetical protein VFT86_05605 [Gaiellaceae bacterium]|nr:hypothetical protein [Gaiellaceae bacterium]